MMEKNAVLGNNYKRPQEKFASRGCPQCGSVVDRTGSIERCPIHGTAPFEYQRKVNGR